MQFRIGQFDVYSYDRNMAGGAITVARLARLEGKEHLRDVAHVVLPLGLHENRLDEFDKLALWLERHCHAGTALRGVLLFMCEYRRTRQYGLFDGVLHVDAAERLFGYELVSEFMLMALAASYGANVNLDHLTYV
jgi:hypothetical protein